MKEVVNQSEPLFQDISITDLDISAKTQVVRSIGWRRINNKKVYLLTVFSTGKTLELAKQSAFTESVKIAVGSLIQSAAYVKEDKLLYNEIYEYSAGYIDYFSVVESRKNNTNIEILINVTVSESKLARKVLGSTKAKGELEGNIASERMKSYRKWFDNSMTLLKQILTDYPSRALSVELVQSDLELIPSSQRTKLTAVVVVGWRTEYIDSLHEIISNVADSNNESEGNKKLFSASFTNNKNEYSTYYFYDKKEDIIRSTFKIIPVIKGTLLDNKGSVIEAINWCMYNMSKDFTKRRGRFLLQKEHRRSHILSTEFESEKIVSDLSRINLELFGIIQRERRKVCDN